MAIQEHPTGDDGVRIVRVSGGRRFFVIAAVAIALPIAATLVAITAIRFSPRPPVDNPRAAAPIEVARADAPAARPTPAGTPGHESAPRIFPRRVVVEPVADPGGPVPGGLGASPVPPPPKRKPERDIDAGDAIVALREQGIHTGIAAFGLPGTNPPKPGILVPEDFALPEGYVRHYQSTDDGEQLPAILMFHPDYEFVNERGEVIPLPDDLVVPPDMAPPGLATDNVLVVPERKVGEPVH